jgi:hypothetical protein
MIWRALAINSGSNEKFITEPKVYCRCFYAGAAPETSLSKSAFQISAVNPHQSSSGKRSAAASSIPPHQTRPSSGHLAPFVGSWLQVLTHSSSSFRSQAMQPPPPAQGLPQGRDWRGRKTMEETMRELTIAELMLLTRIELCDLVNQITIELPKFPEGSPERAAAFASLRNIRLVLARRDFSP